MSGRSRTFPKLRHHKASGQAAVVLDGRWLYLGPWGEPEVEAAYDRMHAEWLTNERRLADPGRFARLGGANGAEASPAEDTGPTVTEVLAPYWRYCERYYVKNGKPTKELANIRIALRPLRRMYGETPAGEFGPLKLKQLREWMLEWDVRLQGAKLVAVRRESPPARTYINQLVDRMKRAFRWGVEEELVPPTTYDALRSVPGLRRGRTTAAEREPIKPVEEYDMRAVLPFLPPPVAAMVEVQWYTGCRPAEVIQLRLADLDRSGEVWLYTPVSHKTEHHGLTRIIPIGPRAQEVLKPFLRLDGGYFFQPRDALAWKHAKERSARGTPLWPSHVRALARKRKAKPKWQASEQYSTDSYRRAIARACKMAHIPTWSPNQLRHARATLVRAKHGLEAAQVSLGQQHARVTEIYAQRDLSLAVRIAKDMG